VTPVVLWTVFVALVAGTVGFLAACLLAATDDPDDDASMREWAQRRSELAAASKARWN